MLKFFVVIFCSFMYDKTFARCPGNLTNSLGTVSYSSPQHWPQEMCDWNFRGLQLQNDAILFIQFRWYFKSYPSITISTLLPNGDLYRSGVNDSELIPTSNGQFWCGLYVKKQQEGETTCQPGVRLKLNCRNQPVASVSIDWPPRMRTNMSFSDVKLQYAFLSCPLSKTSPPVTTTSYLTTERPANTINTTPSSKETTLNQTTLKPNRKETDASFIAALTLGALLTVTLCVITLLLRTRKKKQGNFAAETPANVQNVGSSAQRDSDCTVREPGPKMVHNEIYDSTAADQTEQTVYNELYNVT